jgi:ABC-2 type transport system permease protein
VQITSTLVASVIVVRACAILRGLSLSIAQFALLIGLAVRCAAVFLSIGQALVALVKSTATVNASGRVLFIILVLLGLLGRTGILGDTLKAIAEWATIGALMTFFSEVLNNAAWSDSDGKALLACAGYIILFAMVGIPWFRWESL